MKLYDHGDYKKYIEIQKTHVSKHINRLKKEGINASNDDSLGWVKEEYLNRIINKASDYLNLESIEFIICHGVRCGYESKYFMDKFGSEKVFSTDLSNDAFMFDRTNFYAQDFDMLPNKWISKFDLLYSNAIDHSRDPINTLITWSKQLKDSGLMVVTFSWGDKVTDCDCFALGNIYEIDDVSSKAGLSLLYRSDQYKGMRVADAFMRKLK